MDPGTILATVELSMKILGVAYEYYKNVKGAKKDIERLQLDIEALKSIFSRLSDNAASVTISRELGGIIAGAQNEMAGLLKKLEFGRREKALHTFGLRSLVWPLKKEEFEDIVSSLEKYKTAANLCLCIDQRYGLSLIKVILLPPISLIAKRWTQQAEH